MGWRVARGYRASAAPTSAQTAGLTWALGRGAPGLAGPIWQVPAILRVPLSSSENPPPLPLRPLTGGWALFFATLCRRSPALGMGATTAVDPRAGVHARVGESGAKAPCTRSTQGRGMVPMVDTPMSVALSGTFSPRSPPPTFGTKGGGAYPRLTYPALRTRPAPTSG